MSLYIGKDDSTLELISNKSDKALIIETLRAYMLRFIGQIKLLSRANLPAIKLNHDDSGRYTSKQEGFDGWVFLDGSLFDKTEFSEAYNVFGDTYGSEGNFFRIPNMHEFLNLCPQYLVKTERKDCITYIPDHEHVVNTDITFVNNGVIRNAFTMVLTKRTNYAGMIYNPSNIENCAQINTDTSIEQMMIGESHQGWHVGGHHGNGDGTFMKSDVIFNTSASFIGVPVGMAGSSPANSYPTYNNVIALTYMGF